MSRRARSKDAAQRARQRSTARPAAPPASGGAPVTPARSRIDWHRVSPQTLRSELVELLVAIGLMAIGWLTLPSLLLAVMVELLVTVALSHHFYPQRGLRRHLADVGKILLLIGFLSVFVLASYLGAGGFAAGLRLAPQEAIGVTLLVTFRSVMLLVEARGAGDPRLHWARLALRRGAVVAIGSFFAAFTCFLPGILLASLLAGAGLAAAADIGIGASYLTTLGVLACIASTMSEQELAEIAGNPYLD